MFVKNWYRFASKYCKNNITNFISLLQSPEVIKDKSNQILTAVIQGMRKDEPSAEVRLAGTTALLNALEFVRANFEKEVNFCINGVEH